MSYANSETLIQQALARLNQYRRAIGEQSLANLPVGELKKPGTCALALGLESTRYPGALVYYDGVACASEEQVATLLRAWPDMRRDPYRERWVNNPPEWREFVFRYDHGELTNIAPLASLAQSVGAETSEPEASKEISARPGNGAYVSDQVPKPKIRRRDKPTTMPTVDGLFDKAALFDPATLLSATITSGTPHEINAAGNHCPGIESLDREASYLTVPMTPTVQVSLEVRSNYSSMSEDKTAVAENAPHAISAVNPDTEAVMADQTMTSNDEPAPTEVPLIAEVTAPPDAPTATETVSAPETATASTAPDPVKLADEPYIWAQCTIQVSLQILPESSHSSSDRKVILGVRTHEDAPLFARTRLSDLEPLPTPLTELLTQLADQLPGRATAAAERKRLAEEKAKAEEARRLEATVRAQAKRAVTHSAKSKRNTKPASSLNTFANAAKPQTTPVPNVTQTERMTTTPLLEAVPPASTPQGEPSSPAPASEGPLETSTTPTPSISENSSGKIGDGQPSLF